VCYPRYASDVVRRDKDIDVDAGVLLERRTASPARHLKYPEATQYGWHESPPASRVRESRTHGFNGGRMETRRRDEGK